MWWLVLLACRSTLHLAISLWELTCKIRLLCSSPSPLPQVVDPRAIPINELQRTQPVTRALLIFLPEGTASFLPSHFQRRLVSTPLIYSLHISGKKCLCCYFLIICFRHYSSTFLCRDGRCCSFLYTHIHIHIHTQTHRVHFPFTHGPVKLKSILSKCIIMTIRKW